MLSEETTERLIEHLVNRIEEGNVYVLNKIGKDIQKIGKMSPSDAERFVQVLKFGGDYDKMIKELAKITNKNRHEIYRMFEEIAKKDYAYAKKFYDYKEIKYVPFDENTALKNQVMAIAKMTDKTYKNLTNAKVLGFGWQNAKGKIVFKGLKQAYYDLLDEAVLNVAQGKETFDEVMFRRLKEIGSGVKTIFESTYTTKDGKVKHRQMRLDSAIRMEMKGAIRDLHNETEKIFGEQFGADGVEISVHLNPAPDHSLVQGRQFSYEEFDNFQNDRRATSYDGIVFEPEFHGHDRRSISQYNCYHITYAIVLGVSEPEYSDEELLGITNKNNEGFEFEGKHYTNYEGTQMMRNIERAIRENKDQQIIGRASENQQLIDKAQMNIRILTKRYNEISKASGLPTKKDRLRVSGYHPVKSNG